MMRRLTIVCGLLTAGVALAMAVQGGQTFPGPSSKTASPVTVIPDRPVPTHVKSQWPPVKIPPPAQPSPPLKALPPRPHPEPLHSVASAARTTVGRAVGVVKTLLSIPKLIGQRLANAGR